MEKRSLFLAETAAFEMETLTLEDALALVVLYAENDDDKFERAGVRWLGRLMLERPMDLPVAAQAVELVAKLRGPGAEWEPVRSGHSPGTSSGRHTVPRLAQRLRGARGTRWVMVLAVPNVLRALSEPTALRSAQPSRSRPD